MKNILVGSSVVAALLLSTSMVFAGVSEGIVAQLQVVEGTSSTRVSVKVQVSSCPSGWYAYENADAGTGKIWTALLMTAYASGKSVKIFGTGLCDQYGVENVRAVEGL